MSDWDGTNYNIVANRYQQMFIQGYLDVSGRTFVRNGDVSFNEGNLYVGANITTNRSLVVGYDTSMNGNLVLGKDLTIAGRLNVKNFTSQNIINTTTNNYQLIVSEELSLNGRMFVSGNVMIGSGNEPSYLLDVSSASAAPFRVGVGATNALVVNSSGYVGIGTNNPQVALDVSGQLRAKLTSSGGTIASIIGNGGGSNQYNLDFCSYVNNSGTPTNRIACIDDGLYSGSYAFFTKPPGAESNSLAERMRITSGGNVGIGVTNPAYALDVSSASAAPFRVGVGATNALVVNSTGGVGIGTNNPNAKLAIYSTSTTVNESQIKFINSNTNSTVYTLQKVDNAADYFRMGRNGYGDIVIDSTGKVGIGSATPAVALDVVGNVQCTAGYNLNYSSVPTYTSNQIGYNGTFNLATGTVLTTGAGTPYFVYPFSNGFYFSPGIYIFSSIAYGYISSGSINFMAALLLATSNPGGISTTNSGTNPTSAFENHSSTLFNNGASAPPNVSFTDIITLTSASTYYVGYKCVTSAAGTINTGGFRCSFVRIA